MEVKHSSEPVTEVAQATDVGGLIEIDTKLAGHCGELPHKISDLIEHDKKLAATGSENLPLAQLVAHDKTHTEITDHFVSISALRIMRSLRAAAVESRSKRAK